MIIWITGLSGSGKSTLAKFIISNLSNKLKKGLFISMEMSLEKFLVI